MVQVNFENYQKQLKITNHIDNLLDKIEEDTAHLSRLDAILNHPSYLELVGMGEKIIPYLFHVAPQCGATWIHFCLFHDLSKENPIPPEDAGKFNRIFMHWLKWYTENEKYQNVDVYYGLVE